MLQHHFPLGEGLVHAFLDWEKRVKKGKAIPRWGGELGCRAGEGERCCWEEWYLHSDLPELRSPRALPTFSPSLFPWRRSVVAGWGVPSLQVLYDSHGSPLFLRMTIHNFSSTLLLSVLLWLEGPGFVKDVSSHVVKQISNWPKGYFL